MRISRKVRISDTLLIGVLLFAGGCASPSKPRLSADAQAEALSHFSLGLLAEANGDSAAAFEEFESAIRLDPGEETLYAAAVAEALKLQRPDEAVRLAKQLNRRHPENPEAQLLLARVYALTDQPGRAESLSKQVLAAFPDNTDAALLLAQFYISQDRRDEALKILRAKTDPFSENADAIHLLGVLCIEQARNMGDTPSARAAILEGAGFLQQALNLAPDNAVAWQQLAFALLAANKPDEALIAIRNGRDYAPEDPALAKQLLDLLIQTGDVQAAIDLWEPLAEDTGTEPEIWLQYLAESLPKTEIPKLAAYLEEQIREQPQAAAFYYTQLGSLYIGAGNNPAAERVILNALESYPDDSRLRIVLGYLRLQQERYDEAYTDLKRVRTESPAEEWSNNPFYLYNFLVAAQKSAHLAEAAETLSATYTNNPAVLNQYVLSLLTGRSPVSTENAIELLKVFHRQSPQAAEALYYLMTLQTEQKEYAQAIETAQQFEALAQKNGETNLLTGQFYYQYGSLYERTGRPETAEKLFFKAIDLGDAPIAAASQNYIAYMWAERGEKLEAGLALIRKALAVEPDNGAFLDTLGWIYYMQGRYDEALTELQKAKDTVSDDPTVWEHLGDTWMKLGNQLEASKHWKKALEMSPDSQPLIDRLESLNTNGVPAAADSPAETMPRP